MSPNRIESATEWLVNMETVTLRGSPEVAATQQGLNLKQHSVQFVQFRVCLGAAVKLEG